MPKLISATLVLLLFGGHVGLAQESDALPVPAQWVEAEASVLPQKTGFVFYEHDKDGNKVLTVYAAYDDYLLAFLGKTGVEAEIKQQYGDCSKGFHDSGAKVTLKLVGMTSTGIVSASSKGNLGKNLADLRKNKQIQRKAARAGADLIQLWVRYGGNGIAGVGSQPVAAKEFVPAAGHSVTTAGNRYTACHEIGHNLGLGHANDANLIAPYARGFCNAQALVADWMCGKGGFWIANLLASPTSIFTDLAGQRFVLGDAEHDAVRALDQTVPLVAQYRIQRRLKSTTPPSRTPE